MCKQRFICSIGYFILLLWLNSEFVGKYWMTNMSTTFCVHLYMNVNLKKSRNLSKIFKYSSILNIITSWIILKISYMSFEFQIEQKMCMRRLIYDLVNLNTWCLFCSILLCLCVMICTVQRICLYFNVIIDIRYSAVTY